jgi:hypothetical protein
MQAPKPPVARLHDDGMEAGAFSSLWPLNGGIRPVAGRWIGKS